jgi:hypothetical protein
MYSFPMTANHEMAHQMGYASESECNFIGFLASVKTIIYTSNIQVTAWLSRYCLSNWQAKDEAIFKQLLKTVHPGILKLQGKRAVLEAIRHDYR